MTLKIIRNDLIKMDVDSIVSPTNNKLLMDGGISASIFKAAGDNQLLDDLNKIKSCQTGRAVITSGYKLKAKHIIHAVGPIWQGGSYNEEELLYKTYKSSLDLAFSNSLSSIAFPLISSGTFMFPKERSLKIATKAINDFLLDYDLDVYLVVYDKQSVLISKKLFSQIESYIDDKYVEEHSYISDYSIERRVQASLAYLEDDEIEVFQKESLEDILVNKEETFSQMLLRLIDKSGKSDVEVYKRANIDRRLFSKIRSDKNYNPSKTTAIAFAIALNLNLDNTYDLLRRAGYALSPSSKFDLIIEFFIKNNNYNIYEINEALFSFDQNLLGS